MHKPWSLVCIKGGALANSDSNPQELRAALVALQPYFKKAGWMALIASVLLLAPSVYMLEVYDRVVNSRNPVTLLMLTVLVLMVYAVLEVLDWARSEVMREAGVALERQLGPRLFRAMFESNLKRAPGGSLQTLSDLRQLREFLYSPVVAAVMELPVSLLFLVLVFAIHPLLGWFALVGALVQATLAWLSERTTQPLMSQANRTAMVSQQQVDAMLRNAQVVQAMGMQNTMYHRWHTLQQEFLEQQASASAHAGTLQATTKFWQNVVSSGLLGLACWLLLRNQLNGGGGMMIVASILGGRVLAPLVQGVAQWQLVIQVIDACKRTDHLLQMIPVRPKSMSLPTPKGALKVEALVATAPGSSAPLLKDLSFSLLPGEVLAVVGPSAAGKTTLARMLMGLWSAASGKVRLDGVDVFSWNKAELGPHVGYLPQGVELIDGTLAENIARFGPFDRLMIEAAARAVGLHEWALQLPQGYDSPVGRDGGLLSGGWRQRVGLARALFGNPVFVVLDEPNASLDEAGDAALMAALAQFKARGTTFVVMTHRTSVLDVADKILVLHEGQAQAFGPRDDVLAALQQATAPPVASRSVEKRS
jgi:ATP-binding cassette subfamily C exporter for protease/lipase